VSSQHGENADPGFCQREADQRARRCDTISDFGANDRTNAKPGQKGAHDKRCRNRVRAGKNAEHPLPDNLAQQRSKARRKKGNGQTRHDRKAPPEAVSFTALIFLAANYGEITA